MPIVGTAALPGVPGSITTVAGGGTGDGGSALQARVGNPSGVTVDSAGNVYIADQDSSTVRKVSAAGVITRVAGNGVPGFSGDGGQAGLAQINSPYDVAVDPAGNLYIADYGNARIRKVATDGIITTIGGNGVFEEGGDEGPATSASLVPQSVAVASSGDVYLSDQFSYRVRRIDTGGTIHAFAGQVYDFSFPWFGGDGGPAVDAQLFSPFGLDTDAEGNVFISDQYNSRIRKVDTAGVIHTVAGTGDAFDFQFGGDGGPATEARFAGPTDVAVDASGRLIVSDFGNNRVRQIVPGADGEVNGDGDETITTVAGSDIFGDPAGNGGPATEASLPAPQSTAVDAAGNLFITDQQGHTVRRVDAVTQIIDRYTGGGVGDGGPATNAVLVRPYGMAAGTGGVYVSEGDEASGQDPTLGNRVRRIDGSGVITTVAGTGAAGFSGDGGPGAAALLDDPRGVAVDPTGNLYIADCGNHRVRRVTPGGTITTVAGGGAPGDGVGDGLAPTAAALQCPSGVDVAGSGPGAGSLYVADADGHRVRRVSPGVDGVVDGGPGETITTVVGTGTRGFGGDGGPAAVAQVSFPSQAVGSVDDDPGPDVVVGPTGDLFVADEGNNRVRKVVAGADGIVDRGPGETITTVAGNGGIGVGMDGVAATTVPVNGPEGVTIDPSGNLVIAETRFGRVRRVDAAGTITTIVGTGFPGYSGDGGPATAAQVSNPTQVVYDAAGSLFLTDRRNSFVRRVEAGTPPPPVAAKKKDCGAVITKNTTLGADVGPCPGNGIVIGADNITLNLAGHRIIGTPGKPDSAGIRLGNRTGVTVRGGASKGPKPGRSAMGTVTGFGAGVAIIGGSHNTVSGVNVEDNVGFGTFGDGIGIFFSSHNRIEGNVLTGNGVYDGVGVLGIGSDHNVITGNLVQGTTTLGDGGDGVGLGIVLNPFLDLTYPRRITHTGNEVTGNVVRGSDASGISSLGNTHGTIARNTVEGNGLVVIFPAGSGIGVQSLIQTPPETDMVIEANEVHGNARHGLDVQSRRNVIRGNNAAGNVANPSFFGGFDLRDANTNCDSNVWDANVWGSGGFSPACTTTKATRSWAPARRRRRAERTSRLPGRSPKAPAEAEVGTRTVGPHGAGEGDGRPRAPTLGP